jgi:HSP20 family molecular chaperone IbpA
MPDREPLKKGQEVFIRRPIQIYATVIGPPRDETGLYCVKLRPLNQYYALNDLEPAQNPVLKSTSRSDLFERAEEIAESITRRAYELFESRGSVHGHDRDDWNRAQSEILLNVPVDIRETETELTIRAEVPGFTDENIEVQVGPRSICISGTRQEKLGQTENTVYSERHCDRIFRVLELPSQVDPHTVDLTLNDGILEIRLSKVADVEETAPLAKSASA